MVSYPESSAVSADRCCNPPRFRQPLKRVKRSEARVASESQPLRHLRSPDEPGCHHACQIKPRGLLALAVLFFGFLAYLSNVVIARGRFAMPIDSSEMCDVGRWCWRQRKRKAVSMNKESWVFGFLFLAAIFLNAQDIHPGSSEN